jgi:hypothetical protein
MPVSYGGTNIYPAAVAALESGLIMLRSKVHAVLVGLLVQTASGGAYQRRESPHVVTVLLNAPPTMFTKHRTGMARQPPESTLC